MNSKEKMRPNWAYLALSFLLALMLWVFVTVQDNPVVEQLFDVPIDYINLADNLAISDKTENIKLRLAGTAATLDNITASDINVYVDLTGATLGQYTGRLNFDLPNNVQLSSAERANVTVLIDEQRQMQRPVTVQYLNQDKLAAGYMQLEALLSPNEVLLTGPEDKLALVDRVCVTVDLQDANADYRANLPVTVLDASGNSLLSWVEAQPALIDVLVPVQAAQPAKAMPIKVTLSGRPADGYEISRIVINPAVTTVLGAQSLLDNTDYIYTSAVNVSEATGTVTENVTLLGGEGLTLDKNISCQVMVVIERQETRTISDVVVSLTNTSPALNYTLDYNTVDVEVRGPASAVRSLTSADISAQIDAGSFTVGNNQAFMQLTSNSNVQIITVQPLAINVNVSQPENR